MKRNYVPYVISVLISAGTGVIAALLTGGGMNIYGEINTPPLSPPAFLFPIAWTILYILMGISAAMIYTSENGTEQQKKSALQRYFASLAVNFMWCIVFFNFRAFLTAFVLLILMLFFILRTISEYKAIRPAAAYLQIPYALWVTFAGYLNAAIWILNK